VTISSQTATLARFGHWCQEAIGPVPFTLAKYPSIWPSWTGSVWLADQQSLAPFIIKTSALEGVFSAYADRVPNEGETNIVNPGMVPCLSTFPVSMPSLCRAPDVALDFSNFMPGQTS
jgi:hypothetical protein